MYAISIIRARDCCGVGVVSYMQPCMEPGVYRTSTDRQTLDPSYTGLASIGDHWRAYTASVIRDTQTTPLDQ